MNRERERIRRIIFNKPRKVILENTKTPNEMIEPEINPELLKMFPPERIKKLMEKESRRHKNALEKKWRNYLEAVNK